MSYQEQLAYLRQKREQVGNSVVMAPSTVAQTQPQQQQGWQEMDEETIKAVNERQQKDQWLDDAGEGVNTATSMDVSRIGADEEALFREQFDKDPLTIKYGEKVDAMLQKLFELVQDPNSPMNGEQAFGMFQDTLERLTNGEFDEDEEENMDE